MPRLSSLFIYFALILVICVSRETDSLYLKTNSRGNEAANVSIDFDQRFQHKSVQSIDSIGKVEALQEVRDNELSRVKRGSSYKVKTKVKHNAYGQTVYKTKIKHKNKIKIGGGTGMMLGAGLVGGVVGASIMYHAGKYGKHSFKRHGHDLFMFTPVHVANFTFNATHGHWHDAHGHYLGADGVYHEHNYPGIAHDARQHIQDFIVSYVMNDHKHHRPVIRDGQLLIPMFRYYPFNATHGIWEYSSTSVSVVARLNGNSSGHIRPNFAVITVIILITVTLFNRKSFL